MRTSMNSLWNLSVARFRSFLTRAGGASAEDHEAPIVQAPSALTKFPSPSGEQPSQQCTGLPSKPAEPLDNLAWLKLVEELVSLFDQLEAGQSTLRPDQRAICEHLLSQLSEILERNGVTLIENESAFDPRRHRFITGGTAMVGTAIEETVSPGFLVGSRVLRRAKVRPVNGRASSLVECP